jgi:ureidoacrylate peracid hydrolase
MKMFYWKNRDIDVMLYEIRPALVIIDLQNSFLSHGGSFDKLGYNISKYQRIVPVIKKTYQKSKLLKIPVIFSKAIREKSGIDMLDRLHKILPKKRLERIERVPICVRDTWDSAIIDALKLKSHCLIVEKRRDSIFQDTEFELWLKSLKIDTLIFTGVDSSICVESSLRDAFNRGLDVILLADATASLNEKFYETTLTEVKENFGLVMNSDELFNNLKTVDGKQFLLNAD